MRYNRSDIESTLNAAKRVAARDKIIYYVFATVYGFTVSKDSPVFQKRYMVTPSQDVTLIRESYNS